MAVKRPRQYIEEDPLIEWLAWLMDSSIRVGPWSVGLDPLIGLIPGIGDMAGAAGISKSATIRMVMNVAFDSLLGVVPFLGDFFDFAYKSNIYNLQIYRESIRGDRQPVRDWLFIGIVSLILLVIVLLPIVGLIYLIRLLTFH
jgi:hypothetical protein